MKKISLYIISAALLSMLAGSSCKDDDFLSEYNPTPNLRDGVIRVEANVAETLNTRVLNEVGPVMQGKFVLTYPYYYSGADAYGFFRYLYHYGDVTFGYESQETTGFVNVGTPTAPRELVWSPTNTGTSSDDGIFVYPSSNPSPLILDNFMYKPILTSSATSTSYQGTNNAVDTIVNIAARYPENPYKASIFDAVNGSNDLLWGKVKEKTGTDLISFDLYHRMTRLILNVVVETNNKSDNDTEDLTICLDNASVKITGILRDPVTYMRLTGELLFQTRQGASTISPTLNVTYSDFQLVSSKKSSNYNEPDENGNYYRWANKSWDESISDSDTTFTTQDFVFVPQTLRQGTELRPKIVIAVPRDDVNKGLNDGYEGQDSIYFTGNIPVTMQMDNGEGVPPSLQTLNFDAGKVITLTTKMKPGEMLLEFAPVTVEPWVYKGTFSPTAKQSGIYSAEDLYDLIKFYQANDTVWIHKYGYIDNRQTGHWKFMINAGNLEFEASKIVGQMVPGSPVEGSNETTISDFNFDFRNRDEFYIMPDGTKVSMGIASGTLDNIVKTPANKGIASSSEFTNLLNYYQRNFWQQFIYGTWSDEEEQWTFRITEDLELEYDNIVGQMIPPDYDNPNFKFAYDPEDITVTVNGYPGPESEITPDVLYSIVSDQIPGLYTAQDFTKLLTVLSGSQVEALDQFGTEENGTWTFPLQRNITLNSKDLQGVFYNKNISYDYEFKLDTYTLTLNQGDNSVVRIENTDDLKLLFNLKKAEGINTADDFKMLIEAYSEGDTTNVEEYMQNLSQYGYYCFNSPRWVFFFNEPVTLQVEEIQGTMVPEDGKPAFSFNLNYKVLTLVEADGTSSEVTANQGAEKLYEIVTTPPEP